MPIFLRQGLLPFLFLFICFQCSFGQVSFIHFPENYQLIPRNISNNLGSYTVEGTMQTNGINAVRIKIVQEDNGIIAEVSKNVQDAGSTFSIDFSIPAITKNHRIEFYTVTNGQESLFRSVDNIVAGDVYVVNGQSNAEAGVVIKPEDRSMYQRGINGGGDWVQLRYSNPGNWAGRIAGQILETYEIPVAVFNFAKGGKSIEFFRKDYSPTIDNNFNSSLQTLEDLGLANQVRGVFWFQGETDGWQATIDSYVNDLNSLKNDWRTYYGAEHIYYYQIRSGSCSHPNPFVLEAQRRAAINDPAMHVMSTSNALHDGCHYEYIGGYQDIGDRMFRQLANDLYNGSYSQADAPDILKVEKIGDRDLSLTFTAGAVLSKVGNPWTDFNIEGSGAIPFTGTTVGNKVTLKFSQDIPDNSKLTYRCHSGPANDHIFNGTGVGILSFYNIEIEEGTIDPCTSDNIDPVFTNCPANITLQTNGGSISVDWTAPTASDNCGIASVQSSAVPGQSFSPGLYTVTYTAIDNAGNSANCSFNILIEEVVIDPCATDSVNPVFTNCPTDITVQTNNGGIAVDWNPPIATDNCGISSVQSTASPGQTFDPGSYSVVYTALDNNGNSAICSFNIEVIDNSVGSNNPDCDDNILEEVDINSAVSWTGGFEVVFDASQSANAIEVCESGVSGNARQMQVIAAGQAYELSVSAVGQADGFINMKFMNSSFTPLVQNIENIIIGNNYENYTIIGTAPNEATYVEISLEKQSGNGCLRATNWCLTQTVVVPSCTISSAANNLQCDNRATIALSDDEFTFELSVTGTNQSSSWSTEVAGQVITGSYNEAVTINGGLISNGTLSLTITDQEDVNCTTTISINPPAPCSPTDPLTGGDCSDNLLDNGGFESGIGDWFLFHNANLSTDGNTGFLSLQIDPFGNRALHNMTITAGKEYLLSAYVKGAGEGIIALKFLNDQWTPLETFTQTLSASNMYQAFEGLSEVAPSDAQYLEIALINNTSSALYFDDVCLEKVDDNTSVDNPGSDLGPVDCQAQSEFPWEEWISKVEMGGISKSSGKTIYSNFSQTIFPVNPVNNELSITVDWSYDTRPMYITAYLDWNGDGIYGEHELLTTTISPPASATNVSKSITINFDLPQYAVDGLVNMRIFASRTAVSDPCANIDFGEIEDYLINLNSPLTRMETEFWADQIIIFPNPATHSFYIDYATFSDSEIQYSFINSLGQTISHNDFNKDVHLSQIEIGVEDLEDGIYFLLIKLNNRKPVGKKIVVARGY